MTKEDLVNFVAEKAGISAQRAERAYDAFWEAILSELKTGHFALPYGAGSVNLRERAGTEGSIAKAVKGTSVATKGKEVVKAKEAVKAKGPVKKSKEPVKKPAAKKTTKAKASAKKKK